MENAFPLMYRRKPAPFRQSDIERAIRALKKNGGGRIIVQPDGNIAIEVPPEGINYALQFIDERKTPKREREIIL